MIGVPLITENLPPGWPVHIIKILYSVNVVISIAMMQFPANLIVESYFFHKMKKSVVKTWLINLVRVSLLGGCIVLCVLIGNKLDKFNSVIGTVTATPVAFGIPCLLHYKLCDLTPKQKFLDIAVIVFSGIVLVFCTAFSIWTWNE